MNNRVKTIAVGMALTALASTGRAAEETVKFQVDNQTVVGTLNIPDGIKSPPAVLLLHGFTGSRDEEEIPSVKEGIFKRAARMWADKGIASLRIDFRGSGESDGKYENTTLEGQIKDGIAGLKFLEKSGKVNKRKLSIVGWSMGGVVATGVAAQSDTKLASVSLWNPATNMMMVLINLIGLDGFKKGLATKEGPVDYAMPWGGNVKLSREFILSLQRVDAPAEISHYKGPLLVAVGSNDDIVFPSPEAGEVLLKYHDGPERLLVKPMDHDFNVTKTVDTVDALIDETRDFIVANSKK